MLPHSQYRNNDNSDRVMIMNKVVLILSSIVLLSCGGKTESSQQTDSVVTHKNDKPKEYVTTVDSSLFLSQAVENPTPVSRSEQTPDASPDSWDKYVARLGKSYKVIGIYTMMQGGEQYSLILYRKGGRYYLNSCRMDSDLNHESSEQVRKSGNTYTYSEPGYDMPEKYVVRNGELNSYTYNPDVYEWVHMGEYWQVY